MLQTLLRLLLLAGSLIGISCYSQVQLVSEEEARRPDQAFKLTRAISRGPSVKLVSNAAVDAKSFQFKIALEPKGGAQIDAQSLKIEYLKNPPVELAERLKTALTERLKTALTGNYLTIPVASLPKGTHSFKISVKDTDGREGQSIISLDAK